MYAYQLSIITDFLREKNESVHHIEAGYSQRMYTKEDECINLPNGETVSVCTQWGVDNIDNFILKAQEHGCVINKV